MSEKNVSATHHGPDGTLNIFAPAKINLFLHITGKRNDGYHTLDSLVCFTDIGDEITIAPAQTLGLDIKGPLAHGFSGAEKEAGPNSKNLVILAARALAKLCDRPLDFKVTLVKNIPMGAGLGGGSADAAAVIWGLLKYWDLPLTLPGLDALLLSLGADVPVCFACTTLRVQGIGEVIKAAPVMGEYNCVLIYPGKPCNTKAVFNAFKGEFDAPLPPQNFDARAAFLAMMRKTQNRLTPVSRTLVPEIENVLHGLIHETGCEIARMSGSGSACFGLFIDERTARTAAVKIAEQNQDWWVQATTIGRAGRY